MTHMIFALRAEWRSRVRHWESNVAATLRQVALSSLVCGALVCCGNAWAQQAIAIANEQSAAEEEEEEFDEEPENAMEEEVVFEISADSFEMWVFNDQMPGVRPQDRLENVLEAQVEQLTTLYHLTDAQQHKLRLAGQGDLERFLDRLEHVRDKFELVRRDQNAINQIWPEIHPLQLAANGLYGPSSLFRKSLPSVLNEAQRAEFAEFERERALYQYRAAIEMALARFDIIVPLTEQQRERLVALLLERTRPPRKSEQYGHLIVMVNLARLPEADLREILDDAQYATLNRILQQSRGTEQFLIENGFVEPAYGANSEQAP